MNYKGIKATSLIAIISVEDDSTQSVERVSEVHAICEVILGSGCFIVVVVKVAAPDLVKSFLLKHRLLLLQLAFAVVRTGVVFVFHKVLLQAVSFISELGHFRIVVVSLRHDLRLMVLTVVLGVLSVISLAVGELLVLVLSLIMRRVEVSRIVGRVEIELRLLFLLVLLLILVLRGLLVLTVRGLLLSVVLRLILGLLRLLRMGNLLLVLFEEV